MRTLACINAVPKHECAPVAAELWGLSLLMMYDGLSTVHSLGS